MSAYRFRLETVLRLRRAEELRAREQLLVANVALRRAVEDRDRALARIREIPLSTGPVALTQLAEEQQLGEGRIATWQAARAEVGRALTAATLAQVTWSKAARAVEALERLDTARRSEHLAEEQRLDALVMDDIVTAAFGRRTSPVGSDPT